MSKICLKDIFTMSFRYACCLHMYSSMDIYTFVYVHVVCYSPRLDYFITYSLSLSFDFSPLSSCLTLQNAQPVYLWLFNIKRKIGESHASHESFLIPASLSLSLSSYLFVSFSYPLSPHMKSSVRNSKDNPHLYLNIS